MTLARIAGHSNVSMPSRYAHSSEDAVLTAMAKLGGHKMGQSEEQTASSATVGLAAHSVVWIYCYTYFMGAFSQCFSF
jgi:hypothetical protein